LWMRGVVDVRDEVVRCARCSSEDKRVVMRGGGIAISGVDEAKIFASARGRYGATGEWGIWELRIMMAAR
jgi:hypothetical protein